MRFLTYILILCCCVASAQKTFKNFKGSLIYKETRFHEPITRTIADTISCFYSAEVRDDIDMEAVGILSGEEISVQYLRFNLIKHKDSIFIKYFDPHQLKMDSTFLYPLLKKDTVDGCKGYKIRVDSSPDLHSTLAKKRMFLDFCLDNPNYETTCLGDSTIKFKEYTFDCYVIKQDFHYARSRMNGYNLIFIEKNSLIPVAEWEYCYTRRKARGLTLNTWTLTKVMRLIEVD